MTDMARVADHNIVATYPSPAEARAALIGALLGFVIAWVVSDSAGMMLGAAVAGFVAGGPLGFLYSGYSGLTVSEEWGETFESPSGETSVAVHSTDRSEAERALDALRATHAHRLCVCGRDGRLREVA